MDEKAALKVFKTMTRDAQEKLVDEAIDKGLVFLSIEMMEIMDSNVEKVSPIERKKVKEVI